MHGAFNPSPTKFFIGADLRSGTSIAIIVAAICGFVVCIVK
jgi:hypothetical protein